ncbi:putative secondary metabolism biosynthetic enzyme [Metarhizium acridum]|nr:putative secondary metabolism biosynthetic enzyme [Metarhizium acridum]
MDTMPWLEDHVISNKIICPGTGMLVMALEAVKHMIESNAKVAVPISAFFIPEAHFLRPILIPEDPKTHIETSVSIRSRHEVNEKEVSWFETTIYAYDGSNWSECFQATLQVQYEQEMTQVDGGRERRAETERYLKMQQDATGSCDKVVDYKSFYQALRDRGMAYGPSFSILRDIRWDGQHTSLARVAHDLMMDIGGSSPVHPAPLDAVMHVSLVQMYKRGRDSTATYVPRDVYGLWLSTKNWKQCSGSIEAISKVYPTTAPGLQGSVFVCSEKNTLLLSAERVVMACVSLGDDNPQASQGPNLIYKIERRPLLSQLKGPELQRLCAPHVIPLTESEQEWSDRLETVLRHFAEDALHSLSSSKFDSSALPAHLQIFIQALSSRYGEGTKHDQEEIRQELARCVEYSPAWDLYAEAGRHLEPLIRNELDPLELLTSSEVAIHSYPLLFRKVADDRLRNFLDLASHEKPGLRILEIGAGTGGLTTSVLSILQDLEKSTGSIHFSQYTYTDISPAFFEASQTSFSHVGDRIIFRKLDIEESPETQGFELGSYDMVFAGSVLHATSLLAISMKNVHKLLKPCGHFINVEITTTNLVRALVGFGSLPGWWLSTEDWRKEGPLASEETWGRLMKETGFSGIEASWEDGEGVCLMITVATEAETPADMVFVQPAIRNQGSLLLVTDTKMANPQQLLAERLLREQGQDTRIAPLDQVHNCTWRDNDVVIVLLEVGKSFLLAISDQEFEALRILIQKTQNLLWVTLPDPSTQADTADPRLHMTLGFLRTMRYEEPTKEIVSLMAGHRALLTPDSTEAYIRKVLQLCFQDQSPSCENEFFIQDGFLTVERLVYAADQDNDRRSRIYPTLQQDQVLTQDPPAMLSVGAPGMLDTLRLAETQLPEHLDPETVEIECRAWPVSFRDVMIALDCYADTSDTGGMGWELSGVVSRVGSGVSKFQPGDRVCAATSPGMQTFVQVPVDMVFNIPDAMSFARSVAGLNPLMTAYHGLINLARLKKSDTILIHAAAGSTGQMAICVAQHGGARIFATVGFDEKKQLLMDEFGIPAEDIFYSRDTSFQRGIMRVTGGRGVDVVFNSLSGDKLKASWACIAPFGRFIEIGKADIGANTSLPMAYFAKNVTFAAVDLVHMAAGDAQGVQDLTRACMAMLFETKVGQYPKPLHLFSVKDAEKAFSFIQSGKNTGRTVITLDPDDKVSKYITRKSKWRFSNQATYLLVGGLGGIGRSIMAWMVEKGARYFIAPSRSGVKSHAATDFVAQMDQKGVRVMTSRCDASSSKQLADLLLACSDMPPIKGCINAAMALHDSLFCNMTHSQWKASIQSKVASSWNLHQILPADLDFFILLSSAASIYGAIGQCNYSAACAAQDSIACHRSSKGGKAISINLGLIRDVGAMVEHQELQVSADNIRDVKAVYERDILAIMDYYCDPLTLASKETHTQVLVGGVTPADTDTVATSSY